MSMQARGRRSGSGDDARLLGLLVIEQAKRDLENPMHCGHMREKEYWQERAERFLSGEHGYADVLQFWCDMAEVSVGRVKGLV